MDKIKHSVKRLSVGGEGDGQSGHESDGGRRVSSESERRGSREVTPDDSR